MTPGTQSTLKQGSRVPIITGSMRSDSSEQHTEVQYQDVGLAINATLNEQSDTPMLQTKIEESSVGATRSNAGVSDPEISQTALNDTAALTPGKPLVLGSLDIPGTTRHQEIEVVAEVIR